MNEVSLRKINVSHRPKIHSPVAQHLCVALARRKYQTPKDMRVTDSEAGEGRSLFGEDGVGCGCEALFLALPSRMLAAKHP
jgi:hypothetical protein